MKKLILVSLIAVLSLGCGTGFLNKTLESKVRVNDKEYRVFYEVERQEGPIDWEGKRFVTARYRIKDDATRNSKFYVLIKYDARYGSPFLRFEVFPMYFSKVDNRSFLQEIVLKNDNEEGQKVFRNIFEQLEQLRNK